MAHVELELERMVIRLEKQDYDRMVIVRFKLNDDHMFFRAMGNAADLSVFYRNNDSTGFMLTFDFGGINGQIARTFCTDEEFKLLHGFCAGLCIALTEHRIGWNDEEWQKDGNGGAIAVPSNQTGHSKTSGYGKS